MPASIGVNLRVTGHCRQGGRKYMEDFFSVAYQQTEDEKDLEYAFFGIYDGHGGSEAAAFAKEHLMESIVKHRNFWSDDDEEVLKSIKDGFMATHYAMWRIHDKWPKTSSGLPSTAGTTASIAFIRRGNIYIGHVGDSGITLGYQEPGCSEWKAKPLTRDHKPESAAEMARIHQSGGKVVAKSGVPRVVWNRPSINHKGPVRRSTPIDEIPFLAVARSLGDLWSYNSALNEFVVSPQPDTMVIPINTDTFRCLIFGTDGLYNMLSPHIAVHIVQQSERHNEQAALSDQLNKVWINPSKCLVEKALERWSTTKMRADNTSVITLMLDPPGPPKAEVLRNKKNSYSSSGLQIEVTRYQQAEDLTETKPLTVQENSSIIASPELPKLEKNLSDLDRSFVPKPRESTAFVESTSVASSSSTSANTNEESASKCCETAPKPELKSVACSTNDNDIQINEVSSSSPTVVPENIQSDEENRKGKVKKGGNKKSAVSTDFTPTGVKTRSSDMGSENRVLRERKNTQQHTSSKRKMPLKPTINSVPAEKKQLLLQTVLFHKDGGTTKKPLKGEEPVVVVKSPPMQKKTTPPEATRVLTRNATKGGGKADSAPAPREIRKSTLAQKLRLQEGTKFKAKLRRKTQQVLTKERAVMSTKGGNQKIGKGGRKS